MSPQILTRLLADATGDIQDGDLLLFRGKGLVSRCIQFLTKSDYSHAGMVTWVNSVPFCAEVREFHGGRLVTLQSQVERYPGRIDVYKANAQEHYPEELRAKAARFMERLAGCQYNYWAVIRAGLAHLPLCRLILARSRGGRILRQLDTKAAITRKSPPFCSMAVDMAWNLGAGIDVVPDLESELTEPGHLNHSMFFEYQFTLA